ncbi:MAG: tRNA (N(6)-L-threonylcarbamoyladenosine(37)-C(2))-methylthiotransferase MtaB [Bdellovibrionales bacterium]|nr:tRNA (N(6)-L-threonylcarbamoyladenosine(37)-C(2))-methylthiotransferase MtaB [Bdellovibrionales bacterium]
MNQNSIEIQTFGCKLNHYDSLLMQKSLNQVAFPKKVTILNSCAVTARVGKEIRKRAEKIKKLDSENFVVVVGCGAQVETHFYESTQAVDMVIGNSDRKNLKSLIEKFLSQKKNQQKSFKSNIFKKSEIYSDFVLPPPDKTRAYLKIQEGCDSFCTFCIIPFARGKSKSLPYSFLIDSIHQLEEKGIQEVVLTGVHIGDYRDGDKNLEGLIFHILKQSSIPRIRLTSLEPIEITPKLLECYQDERMCPHFHISLQSTNSKVLSSMKRKYSQKEVEQAFKRITQYLPHAFIGMDIIVGFPTETSQDFKESYQLLRNHSWTNMHVFPYSPRQGTYSYFKYQALDQKEVSRRAKLLRKLSEKRFCEKLKEQVGTTKKVLLFNKDNTKGLSRDYWKIKIPASQFKGEKQVKIIGADYIESKLLADTI